MLSCDNGDVIVSPDRRKKHERLSKLRISKLTQRSLKECGVKWLFPIQYLSYDSVFDGRDLIGQAHELSGGEEEGVKCVWEEETDLEFVADRVCAH